MLDYKRLMIDVGFVSRAFHTLTVSFGPTPPPMLCVSFTSHISNYCYSSSKSEKLFDLALVHGIRFWLLV